MFHFVSLFETRKVEKKGTFQKMEKLCSHFFESIVWHQSIIFKYQAEIFRQ